MPSDCPECFGKRTSSGKLPQCGLCEFIDSCKFCANDDGSKCDRRLGHVNFDKCSYSEDIATSAPSNTPNSDDSEARRIIEFLLDIDNYTAELLSEVMHGNCNTASDLAKKFGVSRQAIHRKIVDSCTEYPNLRSLFITRLYRCRRIMHDSDRLREQAQKKHNHNQMEFHFQL